MKLRFIVLFVAILIIPYNLLAQEAFRQEGIASWYGKEYDGRLTASGEIFDSSKMTAAHPSLLFGTTVVVTNQHNNKKVTVRINDRGPFVAARIIDVSRAAAEQLDMIFTGTAPVLVESIGAAFSPAPASSNLPVITTVNVQQPLQPLLQIKLIPEINIVSNKTYRLQIGSYRNSRYASDTFEKLKETGLNPAYERYVDSENGEYLRVVLAGIRGIDVQLAAERIKKAGFKEALIREEN